MTAQLPNWSYLGRRPAAGQFGQFAAASRGLLQQVLMPQFPQEAPPQAQRRAVTPLLEHAALQAQSGRQPQPPGQRNYAMYGLHTSPSAWNSVVASGIVPQTVTVPGIAPPWIPEPSTAAAAAGDIELESLPDLSDAGPDTDDLDFATPIHYDGSDDVCSICTCPFEGGERDARLICRHVFHSECIDPMCRHWSSRPTFETRGFDVPPCVNCRGGGRIMATWV